jgi:hypothetical protein
VVGKKPSDYIFSNPLFNGRIAEDDRYKGVSGSRLYLKNIDFLPESNQATKRIPVNPGSVVMTAGLPTFSGKLYDPINNYIPAEDESVSPSLAWLINRINYDQNNMNDIQSKKNLTAAEGAATQSTYIDPSGTTDMSYQQQNLGGPEGFTTVSYSKNNNINNSNSDHPVYFPRMTAVPSNNIPCFKNGGGSGCSAKLMVDAAPDAGSVIYEGFGTDTSLQGSVSSAVNPVISSLETSKRYANQAEILRKQIYDPTTNSGRYLDLAAYFDGTDANKDLDGVYKTLYTDSKYKQDFIGLQVEPNKSLVAAAQNDAYENSMYLYTYMTVGTLVIAIVIVLGLIAMRRGSSGSSSSF